MPQAEQPSKQRSRLGRGLSSLLSVSEPLDREIRTSETPDTVVSAAPPFPVPNALPGTLVMDLPVSDIRPNPHQPRRDFDETALAELAASLKSTGLIQPIIVKKVDGTFELIAGERRLRAAKLAGLEVIPAILREADSFTQAQMALIENIQRRDLNPVDRAQAYDALLKQLGLTQSELAGRLGEDRSTIANYLRLMDLDGPVANMLRDGRLSLGHAKLLASVTIHEEQNRLANLVLSQDLSVRNLERLISSGPQAEINRPKRTPSNHLQDLERALTRQLGLRVQVRGAKGGKGRIVIHYGSLDQFDQLADRLGVSLD